MNEGFSIKKLRRKFPFHSTQAQHRSLMRSGMKIASMNEFAGGCSGVLSSFEDPSEIFQEKD